MKTVAVLIALFMAIQAAHLPDVDHSQAVGLHNYLPVLETAPRHPDARIIDGTPATRGQFPYEVLVFLDSESFCGGSLISTRWVLTAAHCCNKIRTFTVYLGAQNVYSSESGRVVITTKNKIIHPSYNYENANNDICLIDLGRDVQLSQYIKTIELATGSNDFVGTLARVGGWGKPPGSIVGGASNTLNYADLSIITNAECTETYGSDIVISSTICASTANGHSTCNGDSGSPLTDPASGVQIGVVSFGPEGSCTDGLPVGFTRVSSFSAWISSNTGIDL